MPQDLITIAIHTPAHARRLKQFLEAEGIQVSLAHVRLSGQGMSSAPVSLSISEHDLPLALRLIENIEIFADDLSDSSARSDGSGRRILVPVDFSDYSFRAARIAFELARIHSTEIVLLHAYALPSRAAAFSMSLSSSLVPDPAADDTLEDIQADRDVASAARESMDRFAADIRDYIKTGVFPAVKFSTVVNAGIPETVINDYARDTKPLLIVMGTRGADKKEREMIGSVTAEVLDSCRFPAFTVPESARISAVQDLHQVLFFSNLDDDDIDALNALASIFPEAQLHVTIAHIPGRRDRRSDVARSSEMLLDYCKVHYPAYTFSLREIHLDKVVEDCKSIEASCGVQLIVLPNKRRSVFSRLFNPSLAHRLLFHADTPMLSVPVRRFPHILQR